MKMRIDDWIPEFRDIIKAGLEESRVVRLLPRHDVYLWVYDGDGRRFALAFQETWKRLPLGARRRLLSYWASARPASGILVSPSIELADYQFGHRRDLAMVDHRGHRLRFRSRYTDRMPDDVLQDLIAHELVHVLQDSYGIRVLRQYSDGRRVFVDARGDIFGGNYEIESDADCTIEGWGFDSESIDRWSLAAGLSKVISFEDPKKGKAMFLRRMERLGR
jgi:hypothetical protein